MSLFEIGVLIFLGYIIIYSIVNRICTCLENRALAKAFGEYSAACAAKPLDIVSSMKNFKDAIASYAKDKESKHD